nr:hypothetical protein [Streptomyces sp. ME02-8801-2C]
MVSLRGGGVAAAAFVVMLGVGGCSGENLGSAGSGESASGGAGGAGGAGGSGGGGGGGAALAAVDSLAVKGRAPKTGYSRDRFGSAWADTDSNKCDTRVISIVHRAVEAFIQLTQGVVSCAY